MLDGGSAVCPSQTAAHLLPKPPLLSPWPREPGQGSDRSGAQQGDRAGQVKAGTARAPGQGHKQAGQRQQSEDRARQGEKIQHGGGWGWKLCLSLRFGPRSGAAETGCARRRDARSIRRAPCAHPAMLVPGCRGDRDAPGAPEAPPRLPRVSPQCPPSVPRPRRPFTRRGAEQGLKRAISQSPIKMRLGGIAFPRPFNPISQNFLTD